MLIAGVEYEVVEMDGTAWEQYRSYLVENARRFDAPVKRFIDQQCAGMTRDERQDALAAWMQTATWNDPPESLVRSIAREPAPVASLCARVLRPKKTAAEWAQAITAENAAAVYSQICAALEPERPPTIQEIMESNAKLREIINRPQGQPCSQQPPPASETQAAS